METSWRGIFDLGPDDTVEVKAGDLQEFLRQQMMGVINPGLTVEVRDGQPSPAKSYDERVSEALRDPARDRQLQRLRREAGWRLPDMAGQLSIPLRKYEAYEKGETPIPRGDAYLIASRLGASPAAVPADLYDYEERDGGVERGVSLKGEANTSRQAAGILFGGAAAAAPELDTDKGDR